MEEYHKITTVYERDPLTKFKFVIPGQYALPEFLYLSALPWQCTEKVDGTNIRVLWDGDRVTFGGKTAQASIPATLIVRLQELFYAGAFATIFEGGGVCLYGEGYGKGIQRGGNYLPDRVDFCLFDVWVNGLWLTRDNVEDIAHKFEVLPVPVVYEGPLREACEIVRTGVMSAVSTRADYVAEGLVMRPRIELQDRRGKRVITKLKYADFPREETL